MRSLAIELVYDGSGYYLQMIAAVLEKSLKFLEYNDRRPLL